MVKRGLLGEKTKKGFYQKVGSDIHALDYKTMEYKPQTKVRFDSLGEAKDIDDVRERIKTLVSRDDRAAQFAWKVLSGTLIYTANRIPEIADDIGTVDQAMKWGLGWELGPFESWDALGVKKTSARIAQEGKPLPTLVTALLQSGVENFYRREAGQQYAFDLWAAKQVEIPARPGIIHLRALHERQQVIAGNPGASLLDLGDGVACLQFHSKNNAVGPDILQMM